MSIKNCSIGKDVKIHEPVNLYDSKIGEGTKIAAFVEIGGARIGKHCKIEAFAFICPGIWIGDYVFIGPHVCFTNDTYPNVAVEFEPELTYVYDGVSIGAGSVILPSLRIQANSIIAAGSVVTKDMPPGSKWIKGEILRR